MARLIMVKPDYQIYPSLLSADFTQIGDEVNNVMTAGADMIHIDVMDNHYVPNLTFGPVICEAIQKRFPKVPMDVHIMANPVDDLINQFASSGAKRISIHPDATIHLDRSLQRIREGNCQAGLAINPATSLDCIQWSLYHLDFVLIMTVNPGFGGQHLIPDVIKKIALLHQTYPHLPICVDGGVNTKNIQQLAQAGATQFVAGSAIFHTKDYAKTIAELRKNAGLI